MTTTHTKTLEELGSEFCVNVDVQFDATIIKERDGDRNEYGQLMTPPEGGEIIIEDLHATEIVGDNYQWSRNQRPDWFQLLDRIIKKHEDDLAESIYENASF